MFHTCRLYPLLFLLLATALTSVSFSSKPPESLLLGRWEVVAYSEQGVQVDKKAPSLPQAMAVWQHIRGQRARQYYGYDEESGERRTRSFERWQERDSTREVARVGEAIAMPYYAVFFADSTLALYNKDVATGRVYFPESRHFVFSPASMSLDVYQQNRWYDKWDVQVLALNERAMTLFLPQEAEIVELVRAEYRMP